MITERLFFQHTGIFWILGTLLLVIWKSITCIYFGKSILVTTSLDENKKLIATETSIIIYAKQMKHILPKLRSKEKKLSQ